MKIKFPKPAGFSLIETVIALGVTSFGLIALLGMVPIGIISSRSSLERSTGAIIAQNVISDLNQRTWSTLTNEHLYFNDEGRTVSADDPDIIYTAVTRIDPASVGDDHPLTGNLIKIFVEIRSIRDSSFPQTFSTLIANRGQ